MTKVIEKKLGRHRALGMTNEFNPKSKILIDPRQRAKFFFRTLLHEKLHLIFPDWSETKVLKIEKELGNFLWDQGCRIIRK